MDDRKDLVILGGGIAGLAAGLTAERLGAAAVVLEAAAEPGGLTRSFRTAGYTFDCSGHVLHLSHPTAKRVVAEVTAPDDWGECERRSFVWMRDRLVPYPFQLHLGHAPPDVRDECVASLPPRDAPAMPPATPFPAWIDAALGAGIGRHFMVPYNEKVATVPANELTCEWLGRFVPTPGIAAIRAGASASATGDYGYNRRFLYPRRGGIDLLWRALAAPQVDRIRTHAEVVEIDTARRVVRTAAGDCVRYETAVVSSLPLASMGRLVVPGSPDLEAAGRLRASAVTCVNLGVRSIAPGFRGVHWLYLPEPRFRAYRVGFYDAFVPAMAPPGRHALYVEIAGGRDVQEGDLVAAAVADLVTLGVIADARDVEVTLPVRISAAYVIHDRECAGARATLHAELARRDVHMVGRYGRWEYAAIEDAIVQGVETTERLLGGRT